jgi:hypothetical protein
MTIFYILGTLIVIGLLCIVNMNLVAIMDHLQVNNCLLNKIVKKEGDDNEIF